MLSARRSHQSSAFRALLLSAVTASLAPPLAAQQPGGGCPDCAGLCAPQAGAPFNRFWARGEFLLWWTDDPDAPPLVTTSPATVPIDEAGLLDEPDTSVLFGPGDLGDGPFPGGRLSLGCWLSPCSPAGVQVDFLGFGRNTARFGRSSDETPVLARPVFDAQAEEQAAMLVAFPNLLEGAVAVDASLELQSFEALWRTQVASHGCARWDVIAGYRFAHLQEDLRVSQSVEFIAVQGQIIPGTTQAIFDAFETENYFHGGELGVVYQERLGPWSLDVSLKLGLGNTHSVVRIDGQTQTTVPDGGSATVAGGLLAQQTNIGRYERDRFTLFPELGVRLGCELTCRLRATAGYTLLGWSEAARAAEQIDPVVSQFPPEAPQGDLRPEARFTRSAFWAQGLTVGLEYGF